MHTSRSVPSWTLFNCYLLLGILVISGYSRRFSLDTRSMQGSSAYLAGPSRKSSYNCLTARTWCLCDRLAFPKEISDLAWTVCGSARFCSSFRSYLQMIMKGSSTIAPSSESFCPRGIYGKKKSRLHILIILYLCAYFYSYAYSCIFWIDLHILFLQNGWTGSKASQLSTTCSAHQARSGKASLGPCWRHWNLSAQHVRRVGRVSRGFM